MIITKTTPYTSEEIKLLTEEFDVYIKTVIDLATKTCSAGCNRHFDSEQILLKGGSTQSQVWGGGIDLETMDIDFNSMINIRPNDGNASNEIRDASIREQYESLTKFFFAKLYE